MFSLSNQMLHRAATYLEAKGQFKKLPIIAVGGVSSAETAWVKLRLGASLVQCYTSLALEGPLLPQKIIDGLAQKMNQEGVNSIDDLPHPVTNAEDVIKSLDQG